MRTLAKHLEEYLEIRHRLGFKLRDTRRELRKFVQFARQKNTAFITAKMALQWATQATDSEQWRTYLLGMVRGFARYLSAMDSRTEVPPEGLLLCRRWRKTPYLYTDAQIVRLIKAAGNLPSSDNLRPATYSTLFGLLAATGLRVGEAIALNRENVDLGRCLLTLPETKFGKWRLVPIHETVKSKLARYERLRNQICPRPKSPSFFTSECGTRLTYCTVHKWFIRLSHQIGLRKPTDHRGPRIHDLRHHFAILILRKWYRSDLDIAVRLPELSTYLGHSDVANTYWYISATPELLKLATERLERENGGPRS
jgi:integrase